jgi:uncharacterized protein (DUF1501 family)
VQLAGGNDGLNTVVPFEDDRYAKARPTLRLPGKQLHKLDDHLGFHPELSAFARLFKEGLLGVVQGVGYPNPHGGHAESMHIWQTARNPGIGAQTGWIGRAVDRIRRDEEPRSPAVFVGEIARPFALNAERGNVPSVGRIEDCQINLPSGPQAGAHREHLAEVAKAARTGRAPLLDFVTRSSLSAYASHRAIEASAGSESRPAAYPEMEFAHRLRLIARLIRSDLGIRIFYTELGGQEPGGFDTHAGQALNHGALLRQLSESIAAFVDDLKRDRVLDRVLLMTFSEFGRTVHENGRRGTDHGSAQPIFVAGGRVRGGLIGRHPDLEPLEGGGQPHHTDFRRLYATAVDTWLGLDRTAILGPEFKPLEMLR